MDVQLTVLIVVLCCFAAEALECKTCMQYDGTSEDDTIRRELKAILEQAGDVNCKNNVGDDSVPTVVCPEEHIEMLKPVCNTAAMSANYTIPDTDMSFIMEVTMRGCHLVLTSLAPSCDPIEKYKDEIMQGMGDVADDMADLSGAMCFCEGDNCNTDEAKADPFTGDGGSENGMDRSVHNLSLVLAVLILFMLMQ